VHASLLLDLDGLAVDSVERTEGTAGGARLVRLRTVDETAAACPSCGVFSTRVKEYVYTRPRDLPQGRGRVELR
jgi:transposase